MRRALLGALLLSAGVVSDALACSCAGRDARSMLAASRTACTGVVESRVSDGQEAVYVVRIEREVKGDLPERVELTTSAHGASCGLENGVGDRLGLALRDEPGPRMAAGLCDTVDPDELIEASGPFPS